MRALLLTISLGCAAHKPDSNQKAECDRMCAHFRALMCAEGNDFYDSDVAGPAGIPNTTCEDFCDSQIGLGVEINAACAAKAPSCEEIETYRAMKSCD